MISNSALAHEEIETTTFSDNTPYASIPQSQPPNLQPDDDDADSKQGQQIQSDCESGDDSSAPDEGGGLSRTQFVNLVSLVVAFGCNIVNIILVVSESGRAILSVGGTEETTTSALAIFYFGSGGVGLLTTRIFSTVGHKRGFLVGSVLALCGSALGVLAIIFSSPVLVASSAFPLGASYGIGYHLRYYSFEAVSDKAIYMGYTLSGGFLAAFLGPEALLLIHAKLPPQYESIAVYAAIAVFTLVGAVALSMIREPRRPHASAANAPNDDAQNNCQQKDPPLLGLILSRRFLVPAVIAMFLQLILAMPGSLIVIVMDEVGFSMRQGILAIELSFAGQWAPAFLSGKLLDSKGISAGLCVSILLMLLGTILLIISGSKEDGNVATWLAGTSLVCPGWVFGFSSATIMSRRYYEGLSMTSVRRIQAANDLVLFLGVAIITYATGYIYAGGGGGLNGWKLVNYVAMGAIGSIALLFVFDCIVEHKISHTETANFKEPHLSEEGTR